MPSPEELARIIKEMREQGLTKEEIRETLADMGVSPDVVDAALAGKPVEVQTSPPAKEEEKTPPPAPEPPAPSRDEDLFAPSPVPSKDVLSELMSAPPSSQEGTPGEAPEVPPPAQEAPPKEEFSADLATPPVLEEESVPSEKLEEIHSKVDALHRAVTSDTLRDDIAEVKELLRELKKEIHNVKSMFSAIQHLLQQVLETDRSILVDLYEKSKK